MKVVVSTLLKRARSLLSLHSRELDRQELSQKLVYKSAIPRKTLILCTDERTGSHLLAQILATTGVLGRAYEYFNTPWMRDHYPDYPESPSEQMAWAKKLGTTPNGVFSLKLHPWAIDRISTEFDMGTDLPDPRFVLLHREDLLGQAISLCRAQQTDSFASWSPTKNEPVYDGDRIAELLQALAIRRSRWDIYFARNGIFPLRLKYEDLTADPQRIAVMVARHVGIPERPVVNSEQWYKFERQADAISEEWRIRFLEEYRGTRFLDHFDEAKIAGVR